MIDTALPAVSDNGRIAFTALLRAGGSGIFIGPDPLQHTVADTSGPFGGMSNPAINDSGEVVFRASFDDPTLTIPYDETTGLFRGPNPATDTIIDNTGNLSRFGTIAINNAGRVAYVAYSDDTTPGNPADDSGGVYVQSGSTPQLVADASGAFRIFSCVGITPTGVPLFKADLDNSARGILPAATPSPIASSDRPGRFSTSAAGTKGRRST